MPRPKSDGGPLDVCEIGEQVGYVGQVKQVKVLGAISLLRAKGVIDWKILAIDINDPLASRLKDIHDVERLLPGLVSATKEWFRCVRPLGRSIPVYLTIVCVAHS